MQITYPKYFLGANSCEGFVSHFSDSYIAEAAWKAYIIKGGPGTGKSSFMKYMASRAQQRGLGVELCVCSSDPNSLDGIIIKDIKTVFLDGTSPHVVEPKYAGACEEIINLGAFWDGRKLAEKQKEIIDITNKNKRLHKAVSGYLSACGELLYDNLKLSRLSADQNKSVNFAKNICKKYIPKKTGKKGTEWVRFIGGITPLGVISYTSTVTDFFENVIIIDDKYGGVSGIITEQIRKYCLDNGYEIITLKNPFLPSELCDHILIPQLSFAVARESEYTNFKSDERRIHARRFTDVSQMHSARPRMLFNRRVARELLLTASTTLSKAKSVHDDLEKYYVDAMDFNAVAKYAQGLADKIFK